MPHSRNNHLAKRSQPTYEELKLSFAGAVVAMVDGSQPTYEELKPAPAPPGGAVEVWFPAYL